MSSRAKWTDDEVSRAPLAYMRPGYSVLVPTIVDRVCNAPPDHLGVYVSLFKYCGLRFPPPHFLSLILHLIGIPLFCYTPNSIGILIAFIQLCTEVKVEPTVRLFRYFFQVTQNKEGYWTISSRKGRILIENPWSKILYKDLYIFV